MEQLEFNTLLEDIRMEDIFEAYYSCRKKKRNKKSSNAFEMDYEHRLFALWQEINTRRYKIDSAIAFIVHYPVRREIFAAHFKDRIVHHLIINKILHLFEAAFIDNSFSCRAGKGTNYGIQTVSEMINHCSQQYTQDCYILKLDLKGFFFHINKKILFNKIKELVNKNYFKSDKAALLFLIEKIIMDNPTEHCEIHGDKKGWELLPKSKSLFHSKKNCGLPIGNLTSQIFANFYLNAFDHYISTIDKDLHYARYVDDFVLIHPSRERLKEIQEEIKKYLAKNLGLSLHPNKIYLQHYKKGVDFIGAHIVPGRIYAGRRLKKSFFTKITQLNTYWEHHQASVSPDLIERTLTSINSYFGLLRHYNTWRLRLKGWNMLHPAIRNMFYTNQDLTKIALRPEWKTELQKKQHEQLYPPLKRKRKKHFKA